MAAKPTTARACLRPLAGLLLAAMCASALAASGARASGPPQSVAHSAVVGGTPAPLGTWGWLAFIENTGKDTECSGTIVSPSAILTAAHCVEDEATGVVSPPRDLTVITGRLDWQDASGGQSLSVSRVVVFPGFNRATFVGDAALLVLSAPTASPSLPLASGGRAPSAGGGTSALFAGWGATAAGASGSPVLNQGSLVVQSDAYCTSQSALEHPSFEPAGELCAVDEPADTSAPCYGDSGGPLIAKGPDGKTIEIGITSHGSASCDPADPTIFTRIDSVSAWIERSTAAAGSQPTAGTPSPAEPAPPRARVYEASTRQQHGHLSLTLAPSRTRLAALRVEFDLHCSAGTRGPLTDTATWSDPLTLRVDAGVWGFSVSYVDSVGYHYTVRGTFSTSGTASGTLMIRTPNGQCTSGRVGWTAAAATR